MAAPESKSIHNLNGKWQMNKSLSDAFEPVLALQGIGFLTRKALGAATLTLHVTQTEGAPAPAPLQPVTDAAEVATNIVIDQTLTGGLKGTTEKRCVDGRPRAHSDWLFGSVEGSTFWVKGPDAAAQVVQKYGDDFFGRGWPAADDLIVSVVDNKDASGGWRAVQVWGFQVKGGQRRYVRNIVVTKGDKRVAVQLVYDFVGERDNADDDLSY